MPKQYVHGIILVSSAHPQGVQGTTCYRCNIASAVCTAVVYIWHESHVHLACCAGSHAVCRVCRGCDSPITRIALAEGCKPAGALDAKGLHQGGCQSVPDSILLCNGVAAQHRQRKPSESVQINCGLNMHAGNAVQPVHLHDPDPAGPVPLYTYCLRVVNLMQLVDDCCFWSEAIEQQACSPQCA
jgi:type IV secretory pathway VirB3-like protein